MSDQILGNIEVGGSHSLVRAFLAAFGVSVSIYYLEYVEAEYGLWLWWLLTPLLVTFLLPAVIILLFYISAIIFHIIKLHRQRLVTRNGDWWDAGRMAVGALWDAHGWLWHGYEIQGIENMPDGPVLLIYYHGALPVDMYYFIARVYLHTRRLVHTVADRFLFKIPGWSIVLEGMCVIPGTVRECAGVLRAGNLLAISPGGVFEAQFGDHNYRLMWKSRVGFAKVALEAKVPILPIFTQNIREAFRTVGWARRVWLRVYTKLRAPLTPVYGGFPVKLITHVGRPIPYDPTLTPQELQAKVANAIEELIEKYQRTPGSITHALIQRIYNTPKPLTISNENTTDSNIPNGNVQITSKKDQESSIITEIPHETDGSTSKTDFIMEKESIQCINKGATPKNSKITREIEKDTSQNEEILPQSETSNNIVEAKKDTDENSKLRMRNFIRNEITNEIHTIEFNKIHEVKKTEIDTKNTHPDDECENVKKTS